MLDVHILTLPDTRRDWQEQCIASVNLAASLAGFPVNVHVVPGVPGHLGRARANGYAVGDAEYQTYVDDDDYVLPHSFSALADALAQKPAAIFTDSWSESPDGARKLVGCPHHLCVYRRGLLDGVGFEGHNLRADIVSRRVAVKSGNVINIPAPLYVWRGKRSARHV